jgi:glycosyltransferase involved in cell wall biosynthesis
MKVLALIEGANEVCSRYRIAAFQEALADRGSSLEIDCFQKGLLGRIGNLLKTKSADAVIIQRKLLPLWQTALLRYWARRLIFDVDDAIYQRDSNNHKGPASLGRLRKYRAMVSNADAVITGNDYLQKATSAWTLPGRVRVIPTCINTRKYHTAEHRRIGREARLIWIGQQATLRLLGMAREFLSAVAQRIPDMEFHQICDQSTEFSGLDVTLRPWSIADEAALLADGDIGIAWMPDDSWSLGKCGLKVLQYMATGLPVVANPVGVHNEMVIHGRTGFLASTPHEWADAVTQLAADPQLRNKMGAAGRELVEKKYSLSAWRSQFADVVCGTST